MVIFIELVQYAKSLGGKSRKNLAEHQIITRNILKKDIRRLSTTDDKRNQIRWFRRNSNLPLKPLHAGI